MLLKKYASVLKKLCHLLNSLRNQSLLDIVKFNVFFYSFALGTIVLAYVEIVAVTLSFNVI